MSGETNGRITSPARRRFLKKGLACGVALTFGGGLLGKRTKSFAGKYDYHAESLLRVNQLLFLLAAEVVRGKLGNLKGKNLVVAKDNIGRYLINDTDEYPVALQRKGNVIRVLTSPHNPFKDIFQPNMFPEQLDVYENKLYVGRDSRGKSIIFRGTGFPEIFRFYKNKVLVGKDPRGTLEIFQGTGFPEVLKFHEEYMLTGKDSRGTLQIYQETGFPRGFIVA